MLAGDKKSPGGRSRDFAGQFEQEEKTLHPDLKVVIHDVNIGSMEVSATEYNLGMQCLRLGTALPTWLSTPASPCCTCVCSEISMWYL